MESLTFGDIETALMDALPALCGNVPFLSSVPEERDVSFVTVRRGGGVRREIVMDSPSVEFECWATTRVAAHTLAEQVRSAVHAMQGTEVGGIFIYRVVEFAGPAYLRHPTYNQHRYVFTVACDVRYP